MLYKQLAREVDCESHGGHDSPKRGEVGRDPVPKLLCSHAGKDLAQRSYIDTLQSNHLSIAFFHLVF